jgi:broad specificity phosphatase PhoE
MTTDHERLYPVNYAWMNTDPLNWAPPGGESIAQVADNRVRELFDSLHRDHDEKHVDAVIAVTHGEFIWATRLVLDYMSNETYEAAEADAALKIHNCHVVHWTRLDPATGVQAPYLKWSRTVWPHETPWKSAGRSTLSNDELLAEAEQLHRLW